MIRWPRCLYSKAVIYSHREQVQRRWREDVTNFRDSKQTLWNNWTRLLRKSTTCGYKCNKMSKAKKIRKASSLRPMKDGILLAWNWIKMACNRFSGTRSSIGTRNSSNLNKVHRLWKRKWNFSSKSLKKNCKLSWWQNKGMLARLKFQVSSLNKSKKLLLKRGKCVMSLLRNQ